MGLGQMQFYSHALGRDVPFNFYVPDRGSFDQDRFPGLIQLHGAGGSYADWIVRTTMAVELADLPLIAVVPDGAGARSGWSNWLVPGQPFEDFIMKDLIPSCEHFFPVDQGRWVVGGNSMGGYGALHLGLKHPDRFASIYAHSSVVFRPERIEELRPGLPVEDAAVADLRLLAAQVVSRPNRPRLGFDCGSEDSLIDQTRDFHRYLGSIGYEHYYAEPTGGHTWKYWTSRLPFALRQHMDALYGSSGAG